MKNLLQISFVCVIIMALLSSALVAQEVKSANSEAMQLSGRVQLQHLYNGDIESDAAKTNQGFRMRRVRLQTKANITPFISAKVQFEVRDNSPSLKDAEAKIKLFDNFYLRAGQFKIPVWREELRSSGKLLLVETSAAAEFLADNYMTARQIGTEFGGKLSNGLSFALNYSNGSGEGAREDAGRTKSEYVNNGKALSGRVNMPIGKQIEVGLSAVMNELGVDTLGVDGTGSVVAIAPDFNLNLPFGMEVEGGMAIGSFDKNYTGASKDIGFTVLDVTARYTRDCRKVREQLGGISQWELAAGFSSVEPNSEISDDEYTAFRFGPALYFGKKVRLQVNGEVMNYAASGVDSNFKIRTQLTINL